MSLIGASPPLSSHLSILGIIGSFTGKFIVSSRRCMKVSFLMASHCNVIGHRESPVEVIEVAIVEKGWCPITLRVKLLSKVIRSCDR